MKNSIQLLSPVAALYMFAAVATASAVTMKAIYTGIVSSGTEFNIADQSGMFGLGTGARVFNNQAFTPTFTYNPSLFGVVHDDTPTSNVARGGPFDVPGSHSPIYNAELLINGVTKKIFSNAAGFVGNYNPLSENNNPFHSTFSQYINANFNVTEN